MKLSQVCRAILVTILMTAGLVLTVAQRADAIGATSAIAAGDGHACVVASNGSTYCWGNGSSGQLGTGSPTSYELSPTLVAGGNTFTSLAAGSDWTCGLVAGGAAYCWGYGGLLGDGTFNGSYSPVAVTGGHSFSQLAAGVDHTCGISAGAAYCWGIDDHGQLGDNSTTDSTSPVLVSGGHTFIAIAAGTNFSCAIDNTQAAWCWGVDNFGQLGDGTNNESHVPVAVTGSHSFSSLEAGHNHICALQSSGAAYCWGSNANLQLGDGTSNDSNSPVVVSGGLAFSSISGGAYETCGVVTVGNVYCWGHGSYGESGTGDNQDHNVPTQINGSSKFIAIAAGSVSVCGVTNGGGVQCWGYGADGELGNNDNQSQPAPVVAWLFVDSENETVSAIVDPSFVFSVAGRSSVCNGQSATNFQTGATSTAVGLGHVTAATVGGGAQDLTVNTNAANGFTVYLKTSGTTPNSLRDALGNSIADVSGTNASPGSAPVAGTAGFGYTSSDASTPFTSNTFAKLTNTSDSVLIGSAGTSSKSACIGYEVAVASTTKAGSYSSVVVYTAVPTF